MAEKNLVNIPVNGEVFRFFGIMPWEFTPEGTTTAISGVNLYFLRERQGAYGMVPDKIKMSQSDFDKSIQSCGILARDLVGVDVVCCFNRYGKCSSFYLA